MLPYEEKQAIAFRYNPQLLDDDSLKRIFVGREQEMQALTAQLKNTALTDVPQHVLLTGARGMGKTMLLHRLALEVRNTPGLAKKWLAPTFPEEQYKVGNLADLWMNVIDLLADNLEYYPELKAEQTRLDQEVRSLSGLDVEEREEKAFALLVAFLERADKGVVLLVDGTDRLFHALENNDSSRCKDGKSSVLWRLRKKLSHQPRLFWIGASYLPLEAEEHPYGDAFFDFFEVIRLGAFSLDEMRLAMERLAATFGMGNSPKGEDAAAEMRYHLDKNPERLKALRVLTNGNPRTMIILYNLLVASDNQDIRGDLNNLLDLMTPLYQSKMEVLPDQQRMVFAHLLDAWAPQTAKQLEISSGLPVTTINSQLTRLEKQSMVEKVRLSGNKRNAYQASERLFNIWYLMRLSSRRLRNKFIWFIDFMRLWYSSDEMGALAHNYRQRMVSGLFAENDITNAAALISAMGDHPEARALSRQILRINQEYSTILKEFEIKEDEVFYSEQSYRNRLNALDKKLARCPYVQGQEALVKAVKGSLALTLVYKETVAEKAEELTQNQLNGILRIHLQEADMGKRSFGEPAYTRMHEAVLEGRFFPDCPVPELALEQIENSFEQDFWTYFAACQLLACNCSNEWLTLALQKIDGRQPPDYPYPLPWCSLGYLLQDRLQRYNEAEVAFRKAIALDEKLVDAWVGLGYLLARHLYRYEEAEAAYRKVIELDDKNAFAWNNLGALLLDHFKQFDEAEVAFQQAIELNKKEAAFFVNFALLCAQTQRIDDAKELFRRALQCARINQEPEIALIAHLFLGNREEAFTASKALTSRQDANSLNRLAQTIKDCHGIALGTQLADLLDASDRADWLAPYTLALRVAASKDPLLFNSAPKEIADLAKEVYETVFVKPTEKPQP